VQLSDLRYQLRAETYNSLLPAHGVSSIDMLNAILQRTQRELWTQYWWPHLAYHVDVPAPVGTRFLNFDATMPFENIESLWFQQSPNQWFLIDYGFGNEVYAYYGGEAGTGYPPQKWRNVVSVDAGTGLTNFNGQLEVWPILSQASTLRFQGMAPLNPLVVDSDKCMIDSTAIILTAAAELLGQNKSEVAALKGQKAQAYIRRLLAKLGANKRTIRSLGKGNYYPPQPTPWIDYIPGA
jgi:hypothetical protein